MKWLTKDGKTIDVKDMSNGHLRNAIAKLKRQRLDLLLKNQDAISVDDAIDHLSEEYNSKSRWPYDTITLKQIDEIKIPNLFGE